MGKLPKWYWSVMIPLLVLFIIGTKYFYSKTGIHPLFILVPMMVVVIIVIQILKSKGKY